MNTYELRLEYFQGPMDKLLELIEEKKLEVSRVSLAEVTDDFLRYLEQFKIALTDGNEDSPLFDAPPALLADFLVVASRLLLIKSKTLLPALTLSAEEDAELHDLEHRLKLYQELKKTQEHIRALWSAAPKMYAREFLTAHEPVFYPPSNATPASLHAAAMKMSGELTQLFKPKATVKNQLVNLRAKIQEIAARIIAAPTTFSNLHGGKGSRSDVVVLFLAVLHLIKQQLADVAQAEHFGEMTIARTSDAAYNTDKGDMHESR